MNKKLLKTAFIWGFILWLIGYLLGILLFSFVPSSLIGWVIMPIGITITLWILFKKINASSFKDYLLLATIWVLIAVIFDYFFLVKLFKPADGYYKLDVFIYYLVTFFMPLIVGWHKNNTL
jgi:hypothetical protein